MKIYRSVTETPPDFGPSALSIGNFDGVHYGHRRIFRRVKQLADERGWKPSVLTFDPHPTRVVAPERSPLLMTSPERRAELMRDEGVEQVLILPFTPEIARLSPEEFVRRMDLKECRTNSPSFDKLCRELGARLPHPPTAAAEGEPPAAEPPAPTDEQASQ